MKKNTRVFSAGTFDGLHPGHLAFLEFARRRGKQLWVVVARDSSARKARGSTPLFSERQRLELAESLKIVDKAILGSKRDWFESVQKINPDVIVLGHDQKIDLKKLREFIRRKRLRAKKIIRAPAVNRRKYSGSRLKNESPHFGKRI